MQLKIDGTDYTSYVAVMGKTLGYNKIVGANGGVTLDGKTHEDVLAYKKVLVLTMLPQGNGSLNTLLAACNKATVTLYYKDYDDTVIANNITCIPSQPQARLALKSGSTTYWDGIQITFVEQ